MVVKTELCSFSENRVYPGHGIRFIKRDGQPLLLSSSKSKSLYNQRKKPAKLTWTQAWRRLNKKGKEEGVAKKKARRVIKVQRAIVGATLDELSKKRQITKPKNVATEAALKEVKERAKTAAGVKKAAVVTKGAAPVIPKNQRPIHNARSGASTRR
eukprot:gene18763-24530_t